MVDAVPMPKSFKALISKSLSSRRLLFARNFLKSPTMLGSIIPSSRFLVNDILGHIDWDTARVIVEYGPGVGTISREILKRMRPDAVLVAIELNEAFVVFLQDEIQDSRIHTVYASARDVREVLRNLGHQRVDYIVSGIPYSTIPDEVRSQITQESRELLQPGGALLVYQFTNAVLPYLKSSFGTVRQTFQWLNILPARIFYCTP
jgi:phospholipid N-methyltransferase